MAGHINVTKNVNYQLYPFVCFDCIPQIECTENKAHKTLRIIYLVHITISYYIRMYAL